MKYSFLVLFLSLLYISSFSQDLIVTIDLDSIDCKIQKVTRTTILYTNQSDYAASNSIIPMARVKTYKYGNRTADSFSSSTFINRSGPTKFVLGIDYGLGYLMASSPDGQPSFIEDYIDELRTGQTWSIFANYYINENNGFGLNYRSFTTYNKLDNVIFINDTSGVQMLGSLQDDIKITFFGPTYNYRNFLANGKDYFSFYAGLGYLGYTNNAIFLEKFNLSSSTVGVTMGVGYDIEISKKYLLGFKVGFVLGALSEMEVESGGRVEVIQFEEEEYENVGRLDLTVGFRFIK